MTNTASTSTAPVAPETWTQEAFDLLTEAEQWAVADLHDLGLIFSADVWPVVKSALGLLFSQLGAAILSAIKANITDPALIPGAVGAALLLTASTSGVTDAKNALASATTAVEADPTVQALLTPPTPASVVTGAAS
jgi:hypothetical protein